MILGWNKTSMEMRTVYVCTLASFREEALNTLEITLNNIHYSIIVKYQEYPRAFWLC